MKVGSIQPGIFLSHPGMEIFASYTNDHQSIVFGSWNHRATNMVLSTGGARSKVNNSHEDNGLQQHSTGSIEHGYGWGPTHVSMESAMMSLLCKEKRMPEKSS